MNNCAANQTARAYVVATGKAPSYWMIGVLWRVIATGIQTGGTFCMLDELCSQGSGPARHAHPQDEGLYVVDGSVSFQAGGATFVAGPGSFVAVPRHTEHSFLVQEQANLLNFYLPAGFELFLMGGAVPAQADTLPPDGLPMPPRDLLLKLSDAYGGMPLTQERSTRPNLDASAQPFMIRAASAESWWYDGCQWSVLADGGSTGGRYCVFEVNLRQGQGIPLHIRDGVDEVHCLLEGEADISLNGRRETMVARSSSFSPRGTVTAIRVTSTNARLLVIHSAPGFDRMLNAFGAKEQGAPVRPPPAGENRMNDLFAEAGWRPLDVASLEPR